MYVLYNIIYSRLNNGRTYVNEIELKYHILYIKTRFGLTLSHYDGRMSSKMINPA